MMRSTLEKTMMMMILGNKKQQKMMMKRSEKMMMNNFKKFNGKPKATLLFVSQAPSACR